MSKPATQQEVLHSRATSAAKRTPKPGSGTGKSHCTDEAPGAAAFTTGLDHPDRSSRNRRMSHSTPGTGILGSAMFNSAIKLDSSVGTMERGSINHPVNPTPMPEQETYRLQAEHTAEQPQNRPTPESGVAKTRPENEVAANPRILALMQERDAAERRLQEAILDLETREQSPAFQKAKELFESGMRLYEGKEDGYDTFWLVPAGHAADFDKLSHVDQEKYSYLVHSKQNGIPVFSQERDLIADLRLQKFADINTILTHLVDLTLEA